MKKSIKYLALVVINAVVWVNFAFAAGLFDRADQDILGNWRFFNKVTFESGHTADFNGTIDLTDATVTATSKITATHITDITRTFPLDLAAGWLASAGQVMGVDGTTAPGIATTDSVPAAVWASPEVAKVQWTFRLPADYSSGLGFYLNTSTSNSSQQIDWELWVNDDATVFDAASLGQDTESQAFASGTTVTTVNDLLTLSTDATDAAAFSAGSEITLGLWRHNARLGNFELKGITAYYTATQ